MRISDWSSDVCSSDLIGQAASVSIPVALLAQDHRPAGACHLHSHDKTAVRNIGHPPDMVHLTRNIGSTASLALLGILTINPVRTCVGEHLRPRLDINPGRGGRITFQMSQFTDFDLSGLAIDVLADGAFLR